MRKLQGVIEIFLQPGELWFGDEYTRIRTLLGSCVAVTLWHPGRRIGGMCHYMLPKRGGQRGANEPDGRYGDEALEILLQDMRARHAQPSEFEAKLFGGGYMFNRDVGSGPGFSSHIQEQNIAAGRKLMASHGFQIKAQHLGGHGHRQVIFDIWSGHVWLKHTPLPTAEQGESDGSPIHPLIECLS
ncbi:chemotaxis protein CheD [Thiobacillus sp.]|uniref:chemotaxis protein CheD n=1 Tax=Thiobacillus sp. TaxID=924 RepID=UPI001855564C|nr:chemotaxis protein CheD [Thiobacillus sp.]MBC2731907.1 chemotaxis protein CheD [Thiobacillus sp.]MBC2740645.1 chemotaxis protein CheD [Thiobacillus sp.]MBC2758502.1 chemotaxis protein CheD [Thiobacillus sp.]